MTTEIPLEFVTFVQQLVSARRFLNEGDVVAEALRLLHARESLRDEAQKGFRQLDDGFGLPIEDVILRVEQRIDEIEPGSPPICANAHSGFPPSGSISTRRGPNRK